VTTANDVACYGELIWDFFEAEGKEKDQGRSFRREIGGASANVATVLARLGVKAAAVGGVGDEKMGEALRAELAREGVDVANVVKCKGLRTGITFVTRDASGEPSFTPYRTGTADMALDAAHVPAASAKVKWGVVSTTSLLPSARAATEKFLAALEKAKGLLLVDLNLRAHLWADIDEGRAAAARLVEKAAVVKASEQDLAALAGKRGMSWLEEHAKSATWVLTRGENGAATVGPHGKATAPTKRVRCIDATGAGDAFVAGLVATLVRSGAKPGSAEWKDPRLWIRMLEVGHALGAKAVSAVGAVSGVTGLDDVRARIDGAKKG